MPKLGADKRFQKLRYPRKIRVGVFHFEEGNMDGAERTLRHGVDLDGQVAEVMKSAELFFIVVGCADGIVQNAKDFVAGFVFAKKEEILVEIVDQIVLTKSLDAEDDNAVNTIQAGHARGKVAGQLGRALGELAGMCGFVEITEKHRIDAHL